MVLGGQTIPVTQTWLKLGVGRLPPQEYKVSIAPVQEYILGLDILWVLALVQTWTEMYQYAGGAGNIKRPCETFACRNHAGLLM